ncbi:hypothetical protein LZ30DRAFT_57772 [Colletotrichum cereale]|nr:hypothetical protein LZ30DRAFT_57772 [Colletotrichum cereale]
MSRHRALTKGSQMVIVCFSPFFLFPFFFFLFPLFQAHIAPSPFAQEIQPRNHNQRGMTKAHGSRGFRSFFCLGLNHFVDTLEHASDLFFHRPNIRNNTPSECPRLRVSSGFPCLSSPVY